MQQVNDYELGEVLPSAEIDQIQDTALGIAQVPGLMVNPPYVYCDDGVNIKVGPIAGMMVSNNPNETLATSGESTITPTLASSTMYALYAYNNGGAIGFQLPGYGTAPPDGALVFEDGDAAHHFLGVIKTNGSGAIIPFVQHGRSVRYIRNTASNTELRVLGGTGEGSDISFTDVNCGTLVPAFARHVDLQVVWSPKRASGFELLSLRTNGITTAGAELVLQNEGLYGSSQPADDVFSYFIPFVLDATQKLEYKVSDADCVASIYVVGYDF